VLLKIQVIFSMNTIRSFETSENIAPTYTATSQKLWISTSGQFTWRPSEAAAGNSVNADRGKGYFRQNLHVRTKYVFYVPTLPLFALWGFVNTTQSFPKSCFVIFGTLFDGQSQVGEPPWKASCFWISCRRCAERAGSRAPRVRRHDLKVILN
jgi:hypothetical protein